MFITYIVCIRCGMSFYYPSYHRRGPPHPTHTNLPVCLSLIGWQHQSRTTAKIGFLHSHLLQHFSHRSTMVIVHHNLNPTPSPSLQQYYILLFKSPSFIYNSYVSLLLRLPSPPPPAGYRNIKCCVRRSFDIQFSSFYLLWSPLSSTPKYNGLTDLLPFCS